MMAFHPADFQLSVIYRMGANSRLLPRKFTLSSPSMDSTPLSRPSMDRVLVIRLATMTHDRK